jgi:hypothetical protein
VSRYEVEIQLDATVWVDVEADSEEEAIEDAEASYSLSDAQWHAIKDVSAKKYAEDAA